ncbi:hypothetical protein [Nocardioides daejeonensis]|uniref:hypothetical protein n=1 Tax=Nocardioides daejeonensis TaxID=1046556 RepID=UPI000D743F7A|nr:hypothetical protein [Nocardioides daejeonensis]
MAMLTWAHHARGRHLARILREGAHRVAVGTYRTARRTPMPRGIREGLRERLTWQPQLLVVPIDRLLLGGQNKLSAADYARASGDLLWPSRRVTDGPHAELLRVARMRPITDVEILGSSYADLARTCIDLSGQYFSAADNVGIVAVARDWLREVGIAPAGSGDGQRGDDHRTAAGRPIEVAPIRDSSCYQVIDGHHRIATAAAQGIDRIAVRVKRWSVDTPLQEMLRAMSWIGGEPLLYQPIEAPELDDWPIARGCVDRLEAMLALLPDAGLGAGAGSSYLDVASCYGWFVAQMEAHGFVASGIERDPLAPEVGRVAYGLRPGQVRTGEAMALLSETTQRWDVVSCFSLLHHFALGRGSTGPEELLQALDRVTARVLFVDTGQAHERWFAESLASWDTDHVRRFLQEHTTFDRVVDLGPDQDDRPPFDGNYGRHLFACVRES